MKNEDTYLSALSKKKLYRVLALVCVVIVFGLIVATLITGITGSRYFMGCLVLTILVPFLFYIFLWLGRVLFQSGIPTEKETDGKPEDFADGDEKI